MNSALQSIQIFVQQLAEVISAVLGLEVAIIDDELKVIAATGLLKKEVGAYYGEGSLTDQLMTSGGFHIVEDTNRYQLCRKCSRQDQCQYLSALVGSIKVGGKVIGTLGITATTLEQKHLLLKNADGLNNFAHKISDLLASAIKEKEANKSLELMTSKYSTIVNSIYEGIISSNEEGTITHINKSAQKLLDLPTKTLIGCNIVKIFSNLALTDIFEHNRCLTRELHYEKENKHYSFASVITPIKQNGNIIGLTISFRAMQEMQRFASKLVGYEASVNFGDIIGESEDIRLIKEKFKKAAVTDSTILIQGESGTGKDLFARAIHAYSLRGKGPFVSINCAAIPETLLESELFGYEEGAFTGARKGGKPGKFELANRGTIFLDEIGDMPLHLQVKLLKVLEQDSIERVGSTQALPIDVRIVAATHRDLENMITRKEFREDLFYRLSVIPVTIPPLRERKNDVESLIDHFLTQYCRKMAKKVEGLDAKAMEYMLNYHWPGNVRELENAIEYAVNMVNSDYIEKEHLPERITRAQPSQLSLNRELPDIKSIEERAIVEALEKFGTAESGKDKAAKYLGISRSTIYRKISKLKKEGKLKT